MHKREASPDPNKEFGKEVFHSFRAALRKGEMWSKIWQKGNVFVNKPQKGIIILKKENIENIGRAI